MKLIEKINNKMGCSSQPEVKANQEQRQQQQVKSQQSQPQYQQQQQQQQQQVDWETEKYISDMKNGVMILGNDDNIFIQGTNTMAIMIRTTYSQKNKMNQMDKMQFNQMKNMGIQQINQYQTKKVQDRNTLIQSYQTTLNKVGPNSRLGKEIANSIQELNKQNNTLTKFCQGLVNEYQNMVV